MASAAPLVLLGAQRSGTTALAAVLDDAFDAVGGTFTINGKLPYLLHRWCTDADVAGRHFRADEVLHALDRKQPYGKRAGAWREQAEQVLRDAAAQVAAGAVTDARLLRREIIARSYARATRFGEKYNEYLLELELLADSLPDAFWVLLVRHPVGVAESMVRWSGDRPWRPGDLDAGLRKWLAWHEAALAHPWVRDPSRCLVIEYGRLCAGPDLTRLESAIDLAVGPYADRLVAREAEGEPALPPDVARVWAELCELGAG